MASNLPPLDLTPPKRETTKPELQVGSPSRDLPPLDLAGLPPPGPAAEPPKSGLDQLVSGVETGLQKAFTPQTVEPEEYHREKSGFEAAVDTLTNIGSGLAVPALATAGAVAAGAAAPAAAIVGLGASALYGLYSAFGNEWSRSKAEGQDFSVPRAAVQAALEINPLLKSSKKVLNLARAAFQVAAAAGTEYSYTEDKDRALAAGGLTLLAAPLMYKAMSKGPKASPAALDAFQDAVDTPSGMGLGRKANELYTQTELPEKPPLEFVQSVVGTKRGARARYDKWSKAVDPEVKAELWEIHGRQKALAQAADELNAAQLNDLDPGSADIGLLRSWLAPAEFVSRKVDDIADIDFEGAVASAARANEKASVVLRGYVDRASELTKARTKAGVSAEDVTRAIAEEPVKLNGAGQAVVDEYKRLFAKIEDEMRRFGATDVAPELREATGAAAAHAKILGKDPLELNVDKVLANYLNRGLRSAIMEPSLKRVAGYLPIFEGLGMKRTAAWTEDWLARANGAPGAAAKYVWNPAMEAIRSVGYRALREDPDSKWGKALVGVPEALAKLNAAVYPHLLGWSPRAVIRQMAQPIMTAAPELRGAYGYSTVTRGSMRAATEVGITPSKLQAYLASKGQLSEMAGEIAPEVSTAGGKASRAITKFNDVGMVPFQYGEWGNRTIAYKTGEVWADDILKGNPAALKALAKSSPGLRLRIARAGGRDIAPEQLGNILGDYLVGKTQFRYGGLTTPKALAHAGTVFSQFTKWPTMTAWNLAEKVQRKDLKAIADWMLPLLALYQVKRVVEDKRLDNNGLAVTARWLTGDPTQFSPVSSVTSLHEIQRGGPLLKAAGKVTDKTVRAFSDVKQLRDIPKAAATSASEAIRQVAKTAMPGAAVLNELDRMSQAGLSRYLGLERKGGRGEASVSRELSNALTGAGD